MAKIYINLEVKISKLEKKNSFIEIFYVEIAKKNPMTYQPVLVRII